MKRFSVLIFCLLLSLACNVLRGQNIAVEGGPFANDWQCLTNGYFTNNGALSWTSTNISSTDAVPQPVLTATPGFAPGKIKRSVTFSYRTSRNHDQTNALFYFSGPLLFSPPIPGSITNAGTNVYTAYVEGKPTSLVGWWPGESNRIDIVNGNNATVGGAAYGPGKVGHGFNFNGLGGLGVPDASQLNFGSNNNFSIEAWIKCLPYTNSYGLATIVDKRYARYLDEFTRGYEFCLSYGKLACQLATGDSQETFVASGPNLEDGNFHHVAMTVERNSSTGGHLYVDGTNVFSFDPTAFAGSLFNKAGFLIGQSQTPGVNANFKGIIDDLAIYDCALSSNEVDNIYLAGSVGKCWTNALPACGLLPLGCYCGNITAVVATVTIVVTNVTPPSIQVQPANQLVFAGNSANFSVTASGAPPLSYQWRFNGTNLSAATSSALAISNVQSNNLGNYAVVITNAFGSVTSVVAALSFDFPFVLITNPTNTSTFVGPANISIQAVATNGAQSVTNVDLYNGTLLLARFTNSPYVFSWSNIAAGSYTLTAIAGESHGLLTTSAPVSLTVSSECAFTNNTFASNNAFGGGFLANLNFTNSFGRLELNPQTAPFKFLNLPCGPQGTMIRFDTTTGLPVGEYRICPRDKPAFSGHAIVDRYGNTWVADWDEAGNYDHSSNGSIARIGIVIGGTRGEIQTNLAGIVTNFVAMTNGHYLKPPFDYCTAIDRNGDGYIKTSFGINDVLDWPTNAVGGVTGSVQNADDECIINYVRVPAQLVSLLALDTNNDLWVGGYCDNSTDDYPGLSDICGNKIHVKVDGITGQVITNSAVIFTNGGVGFGGFDGVVTTNGLLWSSGGGNHCHVCGDDSLNTCLVTYQPANHAINITNDGNHYFGMAIDPQTGNVWSTLFDSTNVFVFDPLGRYLTNYYHGDVQSAALAIDNNSNVWVAHGPWSGTLSIGHLRTDGNFLENVELDTNCTGATHASMVSIDADGKVWAVCDSNSGDLPKLIRISPGAGAWATNAHGVAFRRSVIDPGWCISIPDHLDREAYGDLTGQRALAGTSPSGVWSVIYTNGMTNQVWGTVSWNASTADTNQIRVEARASNSRTQLATNNFLLLSSGLPFTNLAGQNIEIRVTLLKASGTTNSPWLHDLTLDCGTAPIVTVAPSSGTSCPGSNFTFTASFTSFSPLSYQWQKNGTNLSGKTASSVTLTNLSATDAATYSVNVTGPFGAGSAGASLTVWTNLTVSGPSSQTNCEGTPVTFATTNRGTGPLTFVWKKNGVIMTGETNDSVTITNLSITNAGTYAVTVSGFCMSQTNSATLTIQTNLNITGPSPQTNCPGTTANFSVTTTGSGPFTYQWSKAGTPIPGATTNTFSITNVSSADAASYAVVVTGPCNARTNSSTLTVLLTTDATGPTNLVKNIGDIATFQTTASGTGPFTYQWAKNGANIGGATINYYTIPSVGTNDAGTYQVIVSGACGAKTNPAVLTVNYTLPTVVFTSPTNTQLFVFSPSNILLTATATNAGCSITNVFFLNGTTVIGQTNQAPYQVLWTNVAAASNYTLHAVAMDACGGTATNDVGITVNAMPTISVALLTNLFEITNLTFTATAADTDGVVTNVSFYCRTNIGTATSNSFGWQFTWNGRHSGNYPITAVATDDRGASTVSLISLFKVQPTNQPPTVWISYPTNGSAFAAGCTITLTAEVGASTITNVEFFANRHSLGSDPTTPYNLTECCWKPGNYSLVALATDSFGSSSVSTQAEITVIEALPTGPGFWDTSFGMPVNDQCGENSLPYQGVDCLVSEGTNLYCCSGYYAYGPNLYKWDGNNWFHWGNTDFPFDDCDILPLGGYDTPVALKGSQLYVAGFSDGGYAAGQFDGTNWTQLPGIFDVTYRNYSILSGYAPEINSRLQFCLGDLYMYGAFAGIYTNGVENTNIQHIARWDANAMEWVQVGSRLNGPVLAIASLSGHLVIGGMFTNASDNPNANHIAELIGTNWTNLGTGVTGTNGNYYGPSKAAVFSLASCDTNLFVGGDFTIAGGLTNANGIALWTGQEWRTLGHGLQAGYDHYGEIATLSGFTNAIVYSLVAHGNVVYVGGAFGGAVNDSGDVLPVANIARLSWDENTQKWSWSDLDYGLFMREGSGFGAPPPWGYVSALSIMEGTTLGTYDVVAGGSFVGAGASQADIPDTVLYGYYTEPFLGIARWRVGYPLPPGPPFVTLTNPLPNTTFSNGPSTVLVEGMAFSSSTNISSVNVIANGINVGSVTPPVSATNYSYSIDSSTLAVGPYLIKAAAVDANGLSGESKATLVSVKGSTLMAHDDSFTVPLNSSAVSLPVLTNDSSSLRISGITHFSESLGHASVGYDGTYITYTPTPNQFGTDRFAYSVTNSSGQSDFAWVTVKIISGPSVVLTSPNDRPRYAVSNNPAIVPVIGRVVDYDGNVTNVEIAIDGVPWNATNRSPFNFSWTNSDPGFYSFTFTAVDDNGLSNTVRVLVNLYDVAASNIITATIDNLDNSVDPTLGITNLPLIPEGLFDLKGKARDSHLGDSVAYQLLLYRPEDQALVGGDDEDPFLDVPVFANVTPGTLDLSGFHQDKDTNGDLGILDLSHVPNGVYYLRLVVHGGGQVGTAVARIGIGSNLKIGQFGFSEQDLALPVNGIPLTVTRTYNSLNPRIGDFGYSWTMALNSMDVQLDDERQTVSVGSDAAPFADDEEDDSGLPKQVSIRTGGNWDVTLTLPDGRRTTFAFGYDGVWPQLHAKWTAPPDVHATLTMLGDNNINFGVGGFTVPTWGDSDLSSGVAPMENQDVQGWILETQDGTKYHLTRGTANNVVYEKEPGLLANARAYGPPKLTEIEQRSGDKIEITDNGLTHYAPGSSTPTRSIYFDRDTQGRFTALHDAISGSNGVPTVKYVYNQDSGNLIQVLKLVDRTAGTYVTNKYHYDNPNFPHYLTSIDSPMGVPVARNEYDDSGRLTAIVDADGNRTEFYHDTTNHIEVIIDRLGRTNSHAYDDYGNVTASTNAMGEFTLMSYDTNNNNLLSTTDSLGHTTTYGYDDKGNQTNVVNALNRTNLMSYDSSGNMTGHVDPLGNITTNHYDEFGNLTNTVQMDSNHVMLGQSFSRYENGLLVEIRDANGHTNSTVGYDGSGNVTTSTNANGFTHTFGYDNNGNQNSSSYTWTGPSGTTNITTSTEYDAQGRAVRRIDALGNPSQTFYNPIGKVDYTVDKLGNTNRFFYDARGNLIQTIGPDGVFTRTVYNSDGKPIYATDRNGVSGTRTDYDAAGRATNTVQCTNITVSVTAVSEGVWSSSLDSAGTPFSTNSTEFYANGWVKSRTGTDGQKTSYAYYDDGQIKTVTDPLMSVTFYAYDEAGRQQFVTNALNRATQFVYDGAGRAVKTILANNSYITNIFNLLGQQVIKVDQAQITISNIFDLSGQLTGVVMPSVLDPETGVTNARPTWTYGFDKYGRQISTTDAKGRSTTNVFDAFGRQISTRLPLGGTNLMTFDSFGRVSNRFDFKHQMELTHYDRLGRVSTNFWFAAGASAPSNSTEYYYDPLGRVTNITERSGTNASGTYATTFGLPGNGKPRNRYFAALSRTPMEARGFLTGLLAFAACLAFLRRLPQLSPLPPVKFSDLVSAYFACSAVKTPSPALRRLRLPGLLWRYAAAVLIVSLLGSDPKLDFWPSSAHAECVYPINLSADTVRITSYQYDFDGRLTQMNSPEGVINYEYELSTGRHTRTCSTNTEVAYGYDDLGRLKTVSLNKRNTTNITAEVTTYTYTKVGNRSTVTLPNGVVTTYLYDELNRLTNLTHMATNVLLASYSYQLHPTGRRTNAVEILKTEDSGVPYITNTLSWAYDQMYRLTNEVSISSAGVTGTYTDQYQYDLVGNRFAKTHLQNSATSTTTNLFDANDQLLREVTWTGSSMTESNAYGYDDNGSLIAKARTASGTTTVSYGYDLKNKLTSFTDATATTTTFAYNDQGIRVRSSTAGGSATYYLIDFNNHTGYQQTLEEFSTLGALPNKSYVIGDDILAQETSASSFLLYDGHGSTRQLCVTDGSVSNRYNYDAYGQTLESSSSSPQTSLLYCGEQFDAGLGMYNLRARFYNPGNGRLNSSDTFRGSQHDPQSLHKYVYDNCDPVNRSDPSGHFSLIELMVSVTIVTCLSLAFLIAISPIVAAFKQKPRNITATDVPQSHKELAWLCRDSYKQTPEGYSGWTPTDLGLGPIFTGRSFSTQLYTDNLNHYVLAFRGTESSDLGDWYSNIAQGAFGALLPTQYDAASELAERVDWAVRMRGGSLTMTGHSLGGGLAAAAALSTDNPAVTFNAAGLNGFTELFDGALSYNDCVANYSVNGEILTTFQSLTPSPQAFGDLYQIQPGAEDQGKSALTLHGIDSVLHAFGEKTD